MKTAKPTGLELVREFFRQRGLLFIGDTFGLPGSGVVEGAIWDSNDTHKGKSRQLAKLNSVWRSRANQEMILRWSGPEEMDELNELADGLAKVAGRSILIERLSGEAIYLPMYRENGRGPEEGELRKAEKMSAAMIVYVLLLMLGVLLFGEVVVPAIREKGIAFPQLVITTRVIIFLVFRV